jgi:type VI protein secretion system component Hcp
MKTIFARAASLIAASLIAIGAGAQVTKAPKINTPMTPSNKMPGPTLAQTSTMVKFGTVSFPALSWSMSSSPASATAAAGSAAMPTGPSYVDIVKVVDAASPELDRMAISAQPGTLTITVQKGGKGEQLVFSSAMLISVTVDAVPDGQPQQHLRFVYTTVKTDYQGVVGSNPAGRAKF